MICLLVTSCEKEEVISRRFPGLTTTGVTEITEEGVTMNAAFFERGDWEVERYGFQWFDPNHDGWISNPLQMYFMGDIKDETFSMRVEVALEEDRNYGCRAFIKTKDQYIYGNELIFRSKGSNGPELYDFSPGSGVLGDTITITGRYFARPGIALEVLFDNTRAEIVERRSSTLRVLVPELKPASSTISVSVLGNTSVFAEPFYRE